MSAFYVYNDVSLETGVQVFSSPSLIYRYMTYESDQNPERSKLKRFPHGEDL